MADDAPRLTRRRLLALALGAAAGCPPLLAPRGARGVTEDQRGTFQAQVRLLFGVIRIELSGTISDAIDRVAGRYTSRVEGQGDGYLNQGESSGLLRDGRWTPESTRSRFVVYGRESRLAITYDWTRRVVEYESRSETFLLRRLRLGRAVLRIPEGVHVDDVSSATLNLAEDRWRPDASGLLETRVVRRIRGRREGDEEAAGSYGAELVPFTLRIQPDGEGGRPVALVDLTRFSSWAKEDEPARIVFGANRRPQQITCSLILGTSFSLRLSPGSPG